MKAAVLRGKKKISIEDVEAPKVEPGQALVHVKAMPICGSDLHGFQGLIPKRRPVGLIMGHEAAGEVAEVGRDVTNVKVGDRVAIDPQISCGECTSCLRGWTHLCDNMQLIGSAMRSFLHGANTEFIAMPATNLYGLPENVSYLEGGMAEPVGVAIHAAKRAGVTPGSKVTVIGAGTIGLLALQAAKAYGAEEVFITDLSPSKLALARELGADHTINASDLNPVEAVRDLTQGTGVDIVLECVGVEETYQQAVKMLRKRGVIGALGYIDEAVAFPMRQIIFEELSVVGSTGFHWSIDPALEMISSGQVRVRPLITHELSLEDAQQAYEVAETEGAIKVVLVKE